MDLQDLIRKNQILKEMVDIALPTAESDPLHDISSYVYRLVRSVLRKNIMRLQAIHVLNNFDKMSDSSLEIVRNMIEDSISFSYILSSDDPEKLAHTFFEFRHVQAKQDLDYYSKIPDYQGEDLESKKAEINKEYGRIKKEYPEFFNEDGSARHSWTKDGVEGMAKVLIKRKHYSKSEIRNILRAYKVGSRKVHFNPEDLLNFYDQNNWDRASLRSLDIAIKAAAASFTSIVVRYFDAVNYYDNTITGKEVIDKLYAALESIHEEAVALSTKH